MAGPSLGEQEHRIRAEAHKRSAERLFAEREEWAAVAMFYSAYHCMKRALLLDPVFRDMTRLKSFHRDLTPDDRLVSWHKARRQKGMILFGVNDLVQLLYPGHLRAYDSLHRASLEVRYEKGLVLDLAYLETALDGIYEASAGGHIGA